MEDLDCIDQRVVNESAMTGNMSQSRLATIRADRDHLADHAVVVADTRHHRVDVTDPVTDVKNLTFPPNELLK